MKKIPVLFLCALVVAACASDDPPAVAYQPPPPARIVLNVASIDIVDHSEFQPSDSPYNTYSLQPKLADAVRQWVSQNIVAGGGSGRAMVVIRDGSLSAQALPMSQDMGDTMFKRQQATKYTGHADVEIELSSPVLGYQVASAQASRFITLPEDPSPVERQNAYVTMLDGLMHELTQNLSASAHAHLHGSLQP